MNTQNKTKIKQLTASKIQIAGSQNKYAKMLGVSSAMLSYLMNDEWSKISDDMWKRFASGCDFQEEERSWELVQTHNYRLLMDLLQDAQLYANTFGLISSAGSGKTSISRHYANTHKNVFRVECAEYFNKKSFLSELLKAMGKPFYGYTAYQMMGIVQDEILKMDKPLIILDEADKLKDDVLYFFISLYNKLEGKTGLMMCATAYLKFRIERGVYNDKKGYQEIYSRLGRKFVEFPPISGTDIALICQSNGITELKEVEAIVKNSAGDIDPETLDLRRTKRLVHAFKRRISKEVSHG